MQESSQRNSKKHLRLFRAYFPGSGPQPVFVTIPSGDCRLAHATALFWEAIHRIDTPRHEALENSRRVLSWSLRRRLPSRRFPSVTLSARKSVL